MSFSKMMRFPWYFVTTQLGVHHREKSVCTVWKIFSRLRRSFYDSRKELYFQAAKCIVTTLTVGNNLAQVIIINMLYNELTDYASM